MKGTDCTAAQISSASEFLAMVSHWPIGAARATMNRGEIVQAIAWYGALRFQAAKSGVGGTLERPGQLWKPNRGGEGSD